MSDIKTFLTLDSKPYAEGLKGALRLGTIWKKQINELLSGTRVKADFSEFDKEVKQTDENIDKLVKSVDDVGKAADTAKTKGKGMLDSYASIEVSRFIFGAIKNGLSAIVNEGAGFQQAMQDVRAVTTATDADFKKLEANALQLGRSTKFTGTEVAFLQKELAKLGFKPNQITDMTTSILNLSAAIGSELAETASVVGEVLNQFGLKASDTARVTDSMAKAFSSTALDLTKYSESMKYVGTIGEAVGFSLEQTTALLGKLADKGISGSSAGTGLKLMFGQMKDESSSLSQVLGGTANTFDELVILLQEAKKRGQEFTDDALVGLDQRLKTVVIGMANSSESIEELAESLRNAKGSAEAMAKIQLNSFTGSVTLAKSAVSGLFTMLFLKIEPALKKVVQVFTGLISLLNDNSQVFYTVATGIAVLSVAALGASLKLLLLETAMGGLVIQIWAVTTAMAANPFILLAMGIAMVATAFFSGKSDTEKYNDELERTKQVAEEAKEALQAMKPAELLIEKKKIDDELKLLEQKKEKLISSVEASDSKLIQLQKKKAKEVVTIQKKMYRDIAGSAAQHFKSVGGVMVDNIEEESAKIALHNPLNKTEDDELIEKEKRNKQLIGMDIETTKQSIQETEAKKIEVEKRIALLKKEEEAKKEATRKANRAKEVKESLERIAQYEKQYSLEIIKNEDELALKKLNLDKADALSKAKTSKEKEVINRLYQAKIDKLIESSNQKRAKLEQKATLEMIKDKDERAIKSLEFDKADALSKAKTSEEKLNIEKFYNLKIGELQKKHNDKEIAEKKKAQNEVKAILGGEVEVEKQQLERKKAHLKAHLDKNLISRSNYEKAVAKISADSAKKQAEIQKKLWQDNLGAMSGVLNSMGSGYGTFVNSLNTKNMGGRERSRQIWSSMKGDFINYLGDMLKQQAINYAAEVGLFTAKEEAKTAIHSTNVFARLGTELIAAIKTVAITIWELASKIFNSFASIPFGLGIPIAAGVIAGTVGMINSFKKFGDGGTIGGKRHSQGGTIIEAEKGEEITKRDRATPFRSMLKFINNASFSDVVRLNDMFEGLDISASDFSVPPSMQLVFESGGSVGNYGISTDNSSIVTLLKDVVEAIQISSKENIKSQKINKSSFNAIVVSDEDIYNRAEKGRNNKDIIL